MAFIIFPILVLIMVIVVIISYNQLNVEKKKLDQTGKSIQRLQQQEFELMKNANNQLVQNFPEKKNLFEGVNYVIAQAEANTARNLATSIAYHRSMKPALEELLLNSENFPGWFNHADYKEFKNKQKELSGELKKLAESYNLSISHFNKRLNQFPNNILAGMAGLTPYEYYEL